MARPTKMTPETIDKLKAAFLIGATKEEASSYAGISKVTLYNYIEKNPEFMNEIEGWQNDSVLKAKRRVVMELDRDLATAKWYLEKKAKDFRSKVDITSDGEPLTVTLVEFVGDDNADEAE